MRKWLLFTVLLITPGANAQLQDIQKLLNKALLQEVIGQIQQPDQSSSLNIVEPFRISPDTKMISLTVFLREMNGAAYEVSQYVSLDHIKALKKDGQLYFEAQPGSVMRVITWCGSPGTSTTDHDQFQLYFRGSASWEKKLVKAFGRNGYFIATDENE